MAPTVMAIRPEILLAGKATGRAIAALTHRPIKNRLLLVTLLAIALPLLAACGQTASSTPGSTLPAETALEQARQAMAAVQSYGFYVDIGVSNYNGGEPVRSARGVWAVPNKYRLQFENVGQVDASVREIISAGDRTLTIHSDGFQWEIDPDLEQHSVFPSNPFDPSSFSIIPELAQLELQGDAKVDGTDVYHLTGLAHPAKTPTLLSR